MTRILLLEQSDEACSSMKSRARTRRGSYCSGSSRRRVCPMARGRFPTAEGIPAARFGYSVRRRGAGVWVQRPFGLRGQTLASQRQERRKGRALRVLTWRLTKHLRGKQWKQEIGS